MQNADRLRSRVDRPVFRQHLLTHLRVTQKKIYNAPLSPSLRLQTARLAEHPKNARKRKPTHLKSEPPVHPERHEKELAERTPTLPKKTL